MAKLLLLSDEEDLFLRQAIEAWSAVYAGDSDIEERRGNRWNVMPSWTANIPTRSVRRLAR